MKVFLKSLKDDFKEGFFGHWRKTVGFLIAYVGPLLFIGACYVTRTHEVSPANDSWGWSIPTFVWPILFALAIFYWRSFRKKISGKLEKMETQNDIEPGKHYAMIVIFVFLRWAMVVLSFLLVWWVFYEMQKLLVSVAFTFAVVAVIESFGGLFYVWDALSTRKPK